MSFCYFYFPSTNVYFMSTRCQSCIVMYHNEQKREIRVSSFNEAYIVYYSGSRKKQIAYSKGVIQEIMKNNDTNIWTGSRKTNKLWESIMGSARLQSYNLSLVLKGQGEAMLSRIQNESSRFWRVLNTRAINLNRDMWPRRAVTQKKGKQRNKYFDFSPFIFRYLASIFLWLNLVGSHWVRHPNQVRFLEHRIRWKGIVNIDRQMENNYI